MRLKIEKIKSRRIGNTSNPVKTYNNTNHPSANREANTTLPPVWQNEIINRTMSKASSSGGNMCIGSNFSPIRRIPQQQPSEDFLDLITKYVEDRLKSQSDLD